VPVATVPFLTRYALLIASNASPAVPVAYKVRVSLVCETLCLHVIASMPSVVTVAALIVV
jgi:hypothetical protein